MGVVKYTGPVASFHCPTNAEIRSLKVHFSPKQEGSGDPSPENVRPIVGWDGVEVEKRRKNLYKVQHRTSAKANYTETNSGLIISTTSDGTYCGSHFKLLSITSKNIGQTFTFSAKCISATEAQRIILTIRNSDNSHFRTVFEKTSDYVSTFTVPNDFPKDGYYQIGYYCTGAVSASGTTEYSEIQLELGSTATSYEPCYDEIVDYDFGVLGKNKFNAYDWQIDGTCISVENANSLTVSTVAYIENYNFYDISSTKGIQRILSFKTKTNSLSNEKASVSLSVRKNNGETQVSSLILKLNEKDYEEEYSLYIAPECDTIQFRNWAYAGSLTLSDVQLELGSTATAYEPYDPNHTVYGGWVDLISGEVQEEATDGYPYYSIILNGTEEWTLVKQNNETTIFKYGYGISAKAESKSICSHFKMQLLSYRDLGYTNSFVHGLSGNLFIQPANSIASTVEEFQSYLTLQYQNGTPVTILFKANKNLATYQLAPTELQTFLGQNNVWSNADYVEVEYDLHETQDILNRKTFIMANQPHVVTPAAALLQTFTTDVPAPLKECKVHFAPVQDLHGYSNPWPAGGGKNLFNWNVNEQNPDNITNNSSANRIFTNRTYSVGFAYSNYFNPSKITDYSINNGVISLTTSAGGYGVGYAISLEESTQYIISGNFTGEASVYVAYFSEDGTYLGSQNNIMTESRGGKFTTMQYTKIVIVLLTLRVAGSGTFSNIQLEAGSTATSYESYENICPIDGWNGIKLMHSGISLLPTDNNDDPNANYANTGTGSISYDTVENCFVRGNGTGVAWAQHWFRLLGEQAPNNTTSRLITAPYEMTVTLSFDYKHKGVNTVGNTWPIRINGAFTDNIRAEEEPIEWTHYERTVTLQPGQYISMIFYNGLYWKNLRLFAGDTATEFEPYNGTTIPITFPSEVGTIYGGYVDLVKGELVAEYIQRIYDGSSDESWALSGNDTYVCNQTDARNDIRNIRPICDKFYMETTYGTNYRIRPVGNKIYASTVVEWREWLAQNPIQVIYELAEPVHYSLTPQQLKTLRGTNNIWSSANGNLEIKYWKH